MSIYDIPVLTTALAIVISWALFALFCSYLLEAWAQIKAERGRFMKNYLYTQLMDNVNGINWAELVYSHGAVDLLSRDPKKPSNDISPELFAKTLIEVVGSSRIVQSQISQFQQNGIVTNFQSRLLQDYKYGTLILNSSDVVSLFRQAMSYAELNAASNLSGAVNESELYDHLVRYFENWFTEFNQRLNLWYKKRTREMLFYLGVVIALFINVDSIQLFSQFSQNPVKKEAVIEYYKKHPERALTEQGSGASAQATKPDSANLLNGQLVKSLDSLVKAQELPVGWKYNVISTWPESRPNLFMKILGVLISGFAASFGAPFWFDLLRKATSVKI
ncbi:MAG: hypothetical protein J7619_13010 [Dyadobacter sp.]|uniref:hypothetical protein n=1 Tax=Dyadobacter sp. TaxID=1914288 RepID=UPI001B2DAC0B|nr:hypothetical protein [Dyadobacter sp.]MBO9613614.1 hypothetical protein [Dyadobacter sp.]